MIVQAQSIKDVQEAVRAARAVMPVGGGSKPALSAARGEAMRLQLRGLAGIIEYEPEEYTFTALAGTPLQEVIAALAAHNQYLPFDPILAPSGATLGGTVAANSSGSGRYRFGGVRDFILGVRFVDGQGRLVRSGGKVVKNAAGFDLAKLMVGSLGRLGVLVELSFKVFPSPSAFLTFTRRYPDLETALSQALRLASSPFELLALDLVPEDGGVALVIRLGGLASALQARKHRILDFLEEPGESASEQVLVGDEEASYWRRVNDLGWVDTALALFKIPLTPRQALELDARLQGCQRRYTAGANVAWVAAEDVQHLQAVASELGVVGLQLLGATEQPLIGVLPGRPLLDRVKRALDPDAKFLEV